MWSTVWNKRVFNWCCPCANCACQDNCDGMKIMLLPLLLPFGGWLAPGQSTPATYGNEGRWFNHSWFIRRPVCCRVYAHKREWLHYVRIELPSSIQNRCTVLGQLCRQMKIVSTCIHGESFSLPLSFSFTVDYWPNHEVTAMRLLFSLFRVPLQYRQNTREVNTPLASLVTIFLNLATCWERNGLLRNKSVLTLLL